MNLNSMGINDGIIQSKYGKLLGNNINGIPQLSIPLNWDNIPESAVSLAIVCIDYDNYEDQGYSWLHWSVSNIPTWVNVLPEGCSNNINEISEMIIQGKTTWASELPPENDECNRYGGPAPDRNHEYEFRLYALSDYIELQNGYYHNQFLRAIRGKIIEEAVIRGMYKV